jgi:hypothetical protein
VSAVLFVVVVVGVGTGVVCVISTSVDFALSTFVKG